MANIAEGFERQHVPEKLQFYNVAHASSAEVRSLSYVIEDNYPALSADALRLREDSFHTGKIISGLIRSTQTRRGRIFTMIFSLFNLLFPV